MTSLVHSGQEAVVPTATDGRVSIHPDRTAFRAVDACSGTYTTAETDSRYAEGHTDALHDACLAVKSCDALTADLLAALNGMLAIVSDSRGVEGYHRNGDVAEWDEFEEIDAARAAIAKATGGAA